MPITARVFAAVSYISLLIGIAWLAISYPSVTEAASGDALVISITYGFFGGVGAMTAVLLWLAAWRRRNWARWAFLVVTLGGIATIIAGLFSTQADLPFESGIEILCMTMAIVALGFAFTRSARPWFHRQTPTS